MHLSVNLLRSMKNESSTKLSGYVFILVVILGASFLVIGCGSKAETSGNSTSTGSYAPTAALGSDPRVNRTDVLIYNGEGAASADVQALTDIVSDHDLNYELVNSAELNAMSLDDMAKFGLILWPGGYAGVASKSLKPETRIRVNKAVTERGVSYIGFCAGAFIAMNAPATTQDGAPEYGFSILTYGGILPEYEPNGIHQDQSPMIVTFSLNDGSKRDFVWYGGPYFPGAPEVLARYKNGEPAIIQSAAGNGFVVLVAPHPESPAAWTDSKNDADGTAGDIEFAWQLIKSALDRSPMPTI